MRWSWPAFSTGAALGVVVCLLLLWSRDPEIVKEIVRVPVETRPLRETGSRTERRRASAEEPPTETTTAETPPAGDPPASPPAAPTEEAAPNPQGVAISVDGSPPKENVLQAFNGARTFRLTLTNGTLTADNFVISVGGGPATNVNRLASQGLARARKAAEALDQSRTVSDADIDEMLASSDDTVRETAIGLAARRNPPLLDRILRVVRDATAPGSLRTTALYAAVEAAPQDKDVAAAVVAATSDANVDVRRTAIELLVRIGERGGDRAAALLRSGDYDHELLPTLAAAVAGSSRALEFLLSAPPVETAFAVLEALNQSPPQDENVRRRLYSRAGDVLRPLLGTPEMIANPGPALGLAAAAGQSTFLRTTATTASLPTSLRLAAIDAMLGNDACADGRAPLFGALFRQSDAPVELLRAALARLPAELVSDPGVKAALVDLAASHPNAWLQEEARAKLQSSPPTTADETLEIVSASYGKDGHFVDVAPALRAMVVGGRLVIEAGNHLAGDPLVGTVKELSVTYVWRGARRTRTINEYEVLTLP